MIEPSLFQIMNDYAQVAQDDVTVDIGAGLGFLTRFLADKCKRVLAVEADERLVRELFEQFENVPNVTVIAGDVLKTHIPRFDKVVSIPPYRISSRLVKWLLDRHLSPSVLIFQQEFANRLVAPVGSGNYGLLTILTYYHAKCELFDQVPKHMFYPQPEVGSIIVRLEPRKSKPFKVDNEPMFTKMVQSLFTQRNRKVRNAVQPFLRGILAKTPMDAETITAHVPYSTERVRMLTAEDFGVLANALLS